MAHIVFLAPHDKLSGGVKVIFRIANALAKRNIQTTVVVKKQTNPHMPWFLPSKTVCKVQVASHPVIKYAIPNDASCVIHYSDGSAYTPLGNIPQLLLLQGFGTQQYLRECVHIAYPYGDVIATSRWLAEL